MKDSKKYRIGTIIGLLIITSVSSLVTIPTLYSDLEPELILKTNIESLDEPEKKMLDLIAREKAEIALRQNMIQINP